MSVKAHYDFIRSIQGPKQPKYIVNLFHRETDMSAHVIVVGWNQVLRNIAHAAKHGFEYSIATEYRTCRQLK